MHVIGFVFTFAPPFTLTHGGPFFVPRWQAQTQAAQGPADSIDM